MSPWPISSEPSPPRTCPPLAAPSPGPATGRLLEALLRRLSAGARLARRGPAGRRHRHLQRSRPEFLPGQDAHLRRWRGSEYRNADEGWGIPPCPRSAAIRAFLASDRVIDRRRFRPDHLPGDAGRPRLHPAAGAVLARSPLAGAHRARVHQHGTIAAALGEALLRLWQAIGRAVASWHSDDKVLIVGTRGLSHQLDGTRAGFINKPFDLEFMDSMTRDPTWATQIQPPSSLSAPAPRESSC